MTITIDTVQATELPALVELLFVQQARQFTADPRLRAGRSREDIAERVSRALTTGEPLLVAHDSEGHVRGCVRPSFWEIAETSILRAFLTARNGVALDLALPHPTEADAHDVAVSLLAELTRWWSRAQATGALIRWPSTDTWLVPALVSWQFQLDSVCASSPLQPLAPAGLPPASQFRIRPARPEDEKSLVDLFEEELRFHEHYTPFVRSSPAVLEAFRRKLARLWNGVSLEEGAPLIFVAERGDQIVGMGENTLLVLGEDDESGLTPPGIYGCIDNVSVRPDMRGQGIGRRLVQVAFDVFAGCGSFFCRDRAQTSCGSRRPSQKRLAPGIASAQTSSTWRSLA